MFKKVLFSCVAMTLAMTSLAAVGISSAATIVEGDLVKTATASAVYLIQGSEKRVFPHYNVYNSWGYAADFSTVKTVSSADLAAYTDGSAVPFRDGSMFRGTAASLQGKDKTAVFYVSDGKLRDIKSAEIYQALFSDPDWNYVTWVPDDLLTKFDYGLGTQLDSSATYPNGAILQVGTVKYLVAAGKIREFSAGAYEANGYDKSAATVPVYTVTSVETYTAGEAIAGAESGLTTPGTGAAVVTPTGTGLTIAAASDTPGSATVVANAARVPFTKVNLTASSDGAVSVKLTVERTGLSVDANLSAIVFIDEATNRQIGNSKTLSSLHKATSDNISVPAGTTKAVIIAANTAAAPNSGETVGLDVSAVTTSAIVNGTLPIAGNKMTMNSTISIGTVTVTRGPSDPNGTATKEIGTTNFTFVSSRVTINSTENFDIELIEFTNYNGTANDSDVENLKLFVDDEEWASATMSSGIVTFDLREKKVSIAKGKFKDFTLKGDIVDGSARTIDFDIYDQIDLLGKGQTYKYYRLPTFPASTEPYQDFGNIVTISTGSLTISSNNTVPVGNIAEGGTQTELGSWTFKAQGENVIITQIKFDLDFTTSTTNVSAPDLTNITLYKEDGTVVTSATDGVEDTSALTSDDGYVTFTDTFTVPNGSTTYILKADLSTDFTTDETIQVAVDMTAAANLAAKGESTNKAIAESPAGVEVDANIQTIKAGDLLVTTSRSNPASGSRAVKGTATPIVLAEVIYDASNSGEDVKITSLQLIVDAQSGATPQYVDSAKLYYKSTGAEVAVDSPLPEFDSTTANGSDTVTFALTANPIIIKKSESLTLQLKGVVNSSEAAGGLFAFANATSTAGVVVRGVTTGTAVTESYVANNGTRTSMAQALTVVGNGTMTINKSYDTPTAGLVIAGIKGQTVAILSAEALYEDMTLDELTVEFTGDNASSSAADIDTLYLYDAAGNMISSQAVNATSTTFRNLRNATNKFTVPDGESKKLYLKVDLAQIGTSKPGTSGYQIGYKLEALGNFSAKGAISGTGTSAIGSGTNAPTGNTFILVKGAPVITHVTLTTAEAKLSGTQTNKAIYKFTIGADASGGDIGVYKLMFHVATTTASITSFYLYDTTSGETNINASSGALSLTNNTAAVPYTEDTAAVFFLDADGSRTSPDKEERVISAGATKSYELRANTTDDTSTGGDDDQITVKMLYDNTSGRYNVTAQEVENSTNLSYFIWTDRSASSHATSTSDWYNSYLVTGKATSTDTVLTD